MKASTLATILSVAVVTYIYRFVEFSKGAFFIDWLLTNAFLLGTRGSFKLFVDTIKRETLEGQRVLIYGAGCGGELLLRELLNNKKLKIKPVGFIDDDMLKSGKNLRGYPILGNLQRLESLAGKYKLDGLLISFNHSDHVKLDEIKRLCRANGLFLKQFSVSFKDVDPAL